MATGVSFHNIQPQTPSSMQLFVVLLALTTLATRHGVEGQTRSLCESWSDQLTVEMIQQSIAAEVIRSMDQYDLANVLANICPGFTEADATKSFEEAAAQVEEMFTAQVATAKAHDSTLPDCEVADYAKAKTDELKEGTIQYINTKYSYLLSEDVTGQADLANRMWPVFAFIPAKSIDELCLTTPGTGSSEYCEGDYQYIWTGGVTVESVLSEMAGADEDLVRGLAELCPDMNEKELTAQITSLVAANIDDMNAMAKQIRSTKPNEHECAVFGEVFVYGETKIWEEVKELSETDLGMGRTWTQLEPLAMYDLYGDSSHGVCYQAGNIDPGYPHPVEKSYTTETPVRTGDITADEGGIVPPHLTGSSDVTGDEGGIVPPHLAGSTEPGMAANGMNSDQLADAAQGEYGNTFAELLEDAEAAMQEAISSSDSDVPCLLGLGVAVFLAF